MKVEHNMNRRTQRYCFRLHVLQKSRQSALTSWLWWPRYKSIEPTCVFYFLPRPQCCCHTLVACYPDSFESPKWHVDSAWMR